MADAKACGSTGMVQKMGFDPRPIVEDERLARPEAVMLETGGELAEAHGEERR